MTKQGELRRGVRLASWILDAALLLISRVTVVQCLALAESGLCLLRSEGPWEG